jgi:hypothetical protein
MSSSDAPAPLALDEKEASPAPAPASEMERWKTIDGFPNYQVSSEGRVYNKNSRRLLAPYLHKLHNRWFVNLRDGESKHQLLQMSRLIARAFLPNPNSLPEVDHINRDSSNNTLTNLRWVDRSENLRNTGKLYREKHATRVSKYKGIRWNQVANKWYVSIMVNGVNSYLGSFAMESAARRAYDEGSRDLHGTTGLTNESLYGSEQLAVWDREEMLVAAPERVSPSTGHKFVYKKNNGRFWVKVRIRDKQHHVGMYATVEEAIVARDKFLAEKEEEGRSRKRARRE